MDNKYDIDSNMIKYNNDSKLAKPIKVSMIGNGSLYVPVNKRRKKAMQTSKQEDNNSKISIVSNDNQVSNASSVSSDNNDVIAGVLAGTTKTSRDDIKEHVRMLLIKRGLTVDKIIDKYANMLEEPHAILKARDKLDMLEYLNILHGVVSHRNDYQEPASQNNINIQVNNMDTSQLIGYLSEINKKTQEYLNLIKARSTSPILEGEEIKSNVVE